MKAKSANWKKLQAIQKIAANPIRPCAPTCVGTARLVTPIVNPDDLGNGAWPPSTPATDH